MAWQVSPSCDDEEMSTIYFFSLCSESAGAIASATLQSSNNFHMADDGQLALLQGTTVKTLWIKGVQLLCTLDCTSQYEPYIGYRTTHTRLWEVDDDNSVIAFAEYDKFLRHIMGCASPMIWRW